MPVPLTNGSDAAVASGIAISNGNVYVAGSEFSLSTVGSIAEYWKNGVAVRLPGNGSASAIAVDGNDVYVAGTVSQLPPGAGFSRNVAVLWKNGTPIGLSDASYQSGALSLFLSGTDVYVAGTLAPASSALDTTAVYWKNGTLVTLGSRTPSTARSIAVDGPDVYVSGLASTPVIWKNGAANPLNGAIANQVVVDDGNTYVAGAVPNTSLQGGPPFDAAYWKNGNLNPLLPHGAVATSIAIFHPD